MSEYERVKKELNEKIEALDIAHQRIDSLLQQNKDLQQSLGETKTECQSLSDENRERWKSERALVDMLHDVAKQLELDTILQRTHRTRNAVMRAIIKSIMSNMKTSNADMDDIPF